MNNTAPSAAAILRRPEVERITGLSYSTIYRKMRAGQFPGRIRLSDKAVGWRASEIRNWIDQRERIPAAAPAAPVTAL